MVVNPDSLRELETSFLTVPLDLVVGGQILMETEFPVLVTVISMLLTSGKTFLTMALISSSVGFLSEKVKVKSMQSTHFPL